MLSCAVTKLLCSPRGCLNPSRKTLRYLVFFGVSWTKVLPAGLRLSSPRKLKMILTARQLWMYVFSSSVFNLWFSYLWFLTQTNLGAKSTQVRKRRHEDEADDSKMAISSGSMSTTASLAITVGVVRPLQCALSLTRA